MSEPTLFDPEAFDSGAFGAGAFGPEQPAAGGPTTPRGRPDEELLISAYQRQGRSLDDLPYTEQFEAIYAAAVGDSPDEPLAGTTRAQLFHRLHNIRKAGRLPRIGRAGHLTEPPVRIGPEQEQTLAQLVEAALGRISLRDNLPYTPAFDALVADFNAAADLALSPYQVWRLVAKLAK